MKFIRFGFLSHVLPGRSRHFAALLCQLLLFLSCPLCLSVHSFVQHKASIEKGILRLFSSGAVCRFECCGVTHLCLAVGEELYKTSLVAFVLCSLGSLCVSA